MTARHAVLPIGAALVLGLGVYLLFAVRAQPTAPELVEEPLQSARVERAAHPPEATAERAPAAPARSSPVTAVSAPPVPAPVEIAAAPPAAATADDPAGAPAEQMSGPKIDMVMAEANKAYDRGDLEDARQIASRVLAQQPGNVRMLRILVSSACLEGDPAAAQASFVKLPPADQVQMRTRCARYGITLNDRP